MQTMHIRQRSKDVYGCLGGELVALARELELAAGAKGDKRVVKIAVRRDKVRRRGCFLWLSPSLARLGGMTEV